jgi:hypothetical protein
MAVSLNKDTAYGLSQAVIGVSAAPVISRRNPGTNDRGMLGQIWVNRTTGMAFCLTTIAANVYTWYNYNTTVAAVATAGGVTAGTGLVATTGGLTVVAGGAAITGNTAITGTLGVSSTITATLGNITATAGNLVSTLGNIHAVNGNIYTDAGDIFTTLGDIESTAGNIVATLGNITATHGDVVIGTATHGITLPGPTRIINGAGVPANGLAVNVGDIYIRTDAAAINTRIYIATAAGVWTAVVTLA